MVAFNELLLLAGLKQSLENLEPAFTFNLTTSPSNPDSFIALVGASQSHSYMKFIASTYKISCSTMSPYHYIYLCVRTRVAPDNSFTALSSIEILEYKGTFKSIFKQHFKDLLQCNEDLTFNSFDEMKEACRIARAKLIEAIVNHFTV